MIQIKSASFVKSSPNLEETPQHNLPEFAFIGRSNVGKSSLINFIVSHKGLAKTSSQPGKTRLINHFFINNEFYFVDLPGYGYAKTSKTDRQRWGGASEQYLLKHPTLKCLFVLLDINVPPQPVDMEFLSWLKSRGLPFAVVLTKIDKPNQSTLYKHTKAYEEQLSRIMDEGQSLFMASVVKKRGREEILEYVDGCLRVS